ncbi:tyrosine-protein phosphatase non-receptor type 1-like isoform X2 [Sipha flava]|uniref:protein-tyrosine-phosphatase n=1 Tax=Sipha flava TaxID=143950 RepID=A0A2S2QVT2_9HEMI|nr:tyrosine-protein phosphatase non-receptor type 1-like isoform X2 [Sipha flava]
MILILTIAGIIQGALNKRMSWEELKLFRTSWKSSDLNFKQLQTKSSREIATEYNALNSNWKTNISTKTNCDIAMLLENKSKNRYADIIPYDYNRVILKQRSNNYINASFIKYDKNIREYIACQAPMKNTCTDMWQMVLEQDVVSIVMLCETSETNKAKCEKYFPNDEEISIQFGDIKVAEIIMNDYKMNSFTMKNLTVHKGNLKKSIRHFQYHGWPDFGIPKDPSTLMKFCEVVQSKSPEGLIVVHCSAGVGRTGTYITCDIFMQLIQKNIKPLSVYRTVQKLRGQRKNMVQTQDQYEFIYTYLAYLLKQKKSQGVSTVMQIGNAVLQEQNKFTL